jgi:hypothetical protein
MRSDAATLRLAAIPSAGVVTDAVLIALGAGLLAVSAQLSIALPFTPVPITGQTFAVLLVGASLGMVRGATSALLYLPLGVAGQLPIRIGAHRLAGGAPLGSSLFFGGGSDDDGERAHRSHRTALACRGARHGVGEDTRTRPLSVRPRRHFQAVRRGGAAAGGVALCRPKHTLRVANCGS